MMDESKETSIALSAAQYRPPHWALLILATLMMSAYMGLQLVVVLVLGIWLLFSGQPITPEIMKSSEQFIWLSLASGAMGALATVGLAVVWPWGWRLLVPGDDSGLMGWLGWRNPMHIRSWLVPIMTIPFMLLVVYGVTHVFGEAEVDIQLLLFTTPSLRVASSIVVSTIIPLAEELMFRGVIYNTLLPSKRVGLPEWQRQMLPLVVTSLLFAAMHLLAGFETAASIIQVTILSFYLGGLRAITGSVKPSVAGHVTWNLIGALALATQFNI